MTKDQIGILGQSVHEGTSTTSRNSFMIKALALLSTLSLLAVSCSSGVSHVQERSLPHPNPTSFSFPHPIEEVCAIALQIFSIEHQVDKPVFGRAGNHLFAECATNAVFGEVVFRDPANAHDVYLTSMHEPIVASSVYRGRKGGMPFIADFHLHLVADGLNTTVTVTALNPEIINGTRFGVGPCGPGQGNNYEKVKPTTVEEYSILRYLGSNLGITNMPDVVVPSG